MPCKHVEVRGNTTKYFYCKLFDKIIDEYNCSNCLMKIENKENQFNDIFGQIFGKGFGV